MINPKQMLKSIKQTITKNGGLGALIDNMIEPIAPGYALQRRQQRAAFGASNEYYRGASRSRLRSDWLARASNPDAPSWEQKALVDRFRDLERNDPIANGLVDTMGINVVGRGLRPKPKIRHEVIGVSKEEAEKFADMATAAFELFSKFADAREIVTFDHLQFMALTQIIRDGESIALPLWAEESYRPFARCVQLLERECLGDPLSADADRARGIVLGSRGQPLKYIINKTPGQIKSDIEEIAARDSKGRRKIIHAFMPKRPGQTRGIPLFAPVMDLFKDFSDYREAEIVKARIAACLSVIFTSADPHAKVAAIKEANGSLIQRDQPISSISPGMVHYAEYGDSVNVVDPNRGGETFGPFVETVLRLIGTSIGLPYELILKDFSKTNYSSARAALLEGRRVFTNWRSWFGNTFCQAIYELVIEEAYYRGFFDVPNFEEFKHEYCRAMWLGDGWGWVDPVKEITASKLAIEYGFSTHEKECAAQGMDAYEILDEQDSYSRYKETLGSQLVTNETSASALAAAVLQRDELLNEKDNGGRHAY